MPQGCRDCNQTGLCCPTCRGARFLAHRVPGEASWRSVCPLCQIEVGGGYEFNSEKVMDAIMRYIDDWFEGRVEDEVATKQAEIERIRQETEANRQATNRTWKHG